MQTIKGEKMKKVLSKNKILSIIFASLFLLLFSFSFVGCGTSPSAKINIVTTSYSAADWAQNISRGGDVEVIYLLEKGVDAHNYSPTAKDKIKVLKADMFIYVGGESESGWLLDAVKDAKQEQQQINMFNSLESNLKEEETIGSMQGENESDDEVEYDEHVWLSVKNAKVICQEICNKLILLDKENESLYEQNLKDYLKELDGLDSQFETLEATKQVNTVVFCDRFPFRYLLNDYNILYDAAFSGCSTDIGVSPKTVLSLSNTINTNNLKYVVIIENANRNIANAVIEKTNTKDQKILVMNSLQSVNTKNNPQSYLQAMEHNYQTLRTALENR